MVEFWQILLDGQEKGAAAISAAYIDATKDTIAKTDWDAFEAALGAGQKDRAESLIEWVEFDPEEPLERIFFDAVLVYQDEISSLAKAGFKFDLDDPNAIKWIQDYAAADIVQISDASRAALREIIERGYIEGIPPEQQARQIRPLIGLDSRRAKAVDNYRQALLKKGTALDKIQSLTAKYAARLLKQRAETIAINEATEASARGGYESTADAVRRGILNPAVYEAFRIVTNDDRLCPICAAAEGESRTLPDGQYASTGSVIAKMHTRCRCVEGLREISMPKVKQKLTIPVTFEVRKLKETETSVFVPTVPLVEGVFDGWGRPVLRLYEEFSKDAHWLNGLAVVTNHESVTPDARRIGQLGSIENDESRSRTKATTEFFKIDLTQRELEEIRSRDPLHGSLSFMVAELEEIPGEWNGIRYEAIERGPYVFYEYSLVRRGIVTPADGAGFNIECQDCHQAGDIMTENAVQEMRGLLDEAVQRIAVLEGQVTALQDENKTIREQSEADRKALALERFTSRLKPGFVKEAAQLFEAYQADPVSWVAENVDKLALAEGSGPLKGSSQEGKAEEKFDLAREQARLFGGVV